jgi:hypothetical protein
VSAARPAAPSAERGVGLPPGHTGSSFLAQLLREAVERFPQVGGAVALPPGAAAFKRRFPELLARFEAARAASPRRSEIARFLARRAQEALVFHEEGRAVPLVEHLALRADPPRLEQRALGGRPGLQPRVPYRGRTWVGAELHELAERLEREHRVTRAAAAALAWLARRAQDGPIDLSGHSVVALGAGAEIAPTPLLLEAGARVLWVDVRAPEPLPAGVPAPAGTLVHAPEARDLLAEPRRIAAAIEQFAADDPVHVGLFAYAPGEGREWRLAASMNALVQALEPERVRSVSLFISPTSPCVLQPEDVAAARDRARRLRGWQAALARLGVLELSVPRAQDPVCVSRSIVPLQGASYQAAQYVCKILSAESWAMYGARPALPGGRALTVSANVAGVTATRSMRHPVFRAAFLGAPSLGLEVYEPETTRALCGLLVLHDLLNPAAPGALPPYAQAKTAPDRAARLFSQQVHGGMFALPFAVASALRVATLIGAARRPALLVDLLRRRERS